MLVGGLGFYYEWVVDGYVVDIDVVLVEGFEFFDVVG